MPHLGPWQRGCCGAYQPWISFAWSSTRGSETLWQQLVKNLYADVVSNEGSDNNNCVTGEYANHLTSGQRRVLSDMLEDHALGQHLCVLGSKGAGKSELARAFSAASSLDTIVFYLYSELTSRDLLQRRATDIDGNTIWQDSPLVQAARTGKLCVLDGFERIDVSALTALQMLLQDGSTTLPSGETFTTHPSFRCVALGLTPLSLPGRRHSLPLSYK